MDFVYSNAYLLILLYAQLCLSDNFFTNYTINNNLAKLYFNNYFNVFEFFYLIKYFNCFLLKSKNITVLI